MTWSRVTAVEEDGDYHGTAMGFIGGSYRRSVGSQQCGQGTARSGACAVVRRAVRVGRMLMRHRAFVLVTGTMLRAVRCHVHRGGGHSRAGGEKHGKQGEDSAHGRTIAWATCGEGRRSGYSSTPVIRTCFDTSFPGLTNAIWISHCLSLLIQM